MSETCRICQGEATSNEPLFHPCKCRGSIKYIHQECLLQWLKHSNKSAVKCDICNTPYKFRTIYDPQMPRTMPFKYIWAQLVQMTIHSIQRSLQLLLFVVCVILSVPIYLKFCGRIFTWLVDGSYPPQHNNFWDALLFGEFVLSPPSDSNIITLLWYYLKAFFMQTYLPGLTYVIVFAASILAVFIEHEYLVRDSGYTKMLIKDIGEEPRVKLMEVLQQMVRGDFHPNNEQIQRAIDDLRAAGNQNAIGDLAEQALRRLIEQQQHQHQQHQHQQEQQHQEQQHQEQQHQEQQQGLDDIEAEDGNEHENIFQGPVNPQNQAPNVAATDGNDTEDDQEIDENNANIANPPNLAFNRNRDINLNQAVNDAANPFDNEEFDWQDEDIDEEQLANGDIFAFFGININSFRTPVLLMFVGNLIVSVYILLVYCIPQLLGVLVISALSLFIRPLVDYVPRYKFEGWNNVFWKYLVNNIANPPLQLASRLFSIQIQNSGDKSPQLADRIIYVLCGYALIGFAIYQFMASILSIRKPIMGNPRKIYKVLFEAVMTIKVFVIFTVDIVFFPMYCGWLLDFCLAPLALETFIKNDSELVLFWSSEYVSQYGFFPTLITYWFLGTAYMVIFAIYVGMVREKILRKGVLFFIRSPDDPNTRLVHDALTQPFKLQLSRIQLSARGYTGLIIICIGIVTWSLRALLPNLLPLSMPFSTKNLLIYILPIIMLKEKEIITKLVCWYWTKAFAFCSHKLRLSHFMLGRPIPQERGHVIYRNIFEQLLARAEPDYSNPVTFKEAARIFKETSVKAVFVPDGNYIRVPNSDASRRFIKTLFVPVTKDDRLIGDPPVIKDDGYISDEEDVYTNTYTIVYRPPYLKTRSFVLLLMLWMFAVVLILGTIFVSLFIGNKLSSLIIKESSSNSRADINSIIIGLVVINMSIRFGYDKFYSGDFDFGDTLTNGLRPVILYLSYIIAVMAWVNWIAKAHKICIDIPIRAYNNQDINQISNEFMLSRLSLFLHATVSGFTVLPFCRMIVSIMKDYFGAKPQFYQTKYIWKSYILPAIGFSLISLCPVYLGVYWPALGMISLIVGEIVIAGIHLFGKITYKVKNDKYVKGKAIENMEGSD